MARSFDGVTWGQFVGINTGGPSRWANRTGGNSFSFWMRPNADEADQRVFHAWGSHFIFTTLGTSGSLRFVSVWGPYQQIDAAGVIPAGSWHHVGLTWTDGGVATLYVNGVSVGVSGAFSGSGTDIAWLAIGGSPYEPWLTFNGRVAEVACWFGTDIGSSAIAALAAGGNPVAVAPTGLTDYWPLLGDVSPETALVGGYDMPINASSPLPGKAAHPPIAPWVRSQSASQTTDVEGSPALTGAAETLASSQFSTVEGSPALTGDVATSALAQQSALFADLRFPWNRRYALQKRLNARDAGEDAIESLWLGKQRAVTSDDLPDTFPALTSLWYPPALGLHTAEQTEALRWYTTAADLWQVTEQELLNVGLTAREVEAVLAAVETL